MKNIFAFALLIMMVMSCQQENLSDSLNGTLNGSYATLLVVGDYLYAINEQEMTTFDITDNKNPQEVDKQDVGFDIENIYHNNGVLFIGSSQALHIFEIDESGIPVRKSETSYFFSEGITTCDPVIANDNYAYVTLSSIVESNGPCVRWVEINELRIFDVTEIENPALLSITNMDFPKGLALSGNHLFVCEGNLGLKVYDVSNPELPVQIEFLDGFESYDIILKGELMMIVCPTEIRQYDISDVNDIQYLSSIDL